MIIYIYAGLQEMVIEILIFIWKQVVFSVIACFIKRRSSMLISEGNGLHFASIRDMWK